jgi:hypothetical protein
MTATLYEPMQRMQDSKTFSETGNSDSALASSDKKLQLLNRISKESQNLGKEMKGPGRSH